jgi:hypothetical protein
VKFAKIWKWNVAQIPSLLQRKRKKKMQETNQERVARQNRERDIARGKVVPDTAPEEVFEEIDEEEDED